MEHETPTSKDIAAAVLSYEQGDDVGLNELLEAAQRTFATLNSHFSARLGSGGYQALLKRAVSLARTDLPGLASVHVSDDGSVQGFQDMAQCQTVTETCVAILSRFIELLDTFVGRTLTVRLLHKAWPGAVESDAIHRQGEQNG